MKKVLAVTLALVICIAGTALAAQHRAAPQQNAPTRMNQPMQQRMNRPEMPGHDSPRAPKARRGSRTFTPDMPKEIREKSAELAKLRIDLEEAMTSRPLNREKALDVHAKIQKVKQEIETWRFTQRLERIESRQKKGLPPAPENEKVSPAENPAPEEKAKASDDEDDDNDDD